MNYPDQKFPMFPKFRGKQVLMRDENGLEKCVACGLCAVACPADAIYLEAAENDGTVLAGPRYAQVYQIHKTRCIFCGYCEEACPVSAVFMGKDYELAVYSNKDFIWDKPDMLVPLAREAGDASVAPRRTGGALAGARRWHAMRCGRSPQPAMRAQLARRAAAWLAPGRSAPRGPCRRGRGSISRSIPACSIGCDADIVPSGAPGDGITHDFVRT